LTLWAHAGAPKARAKPAAKIQQDLAAAEEEWLRLELLREEVQGA